MPPQTHSEPSADEVIYYASRGRWALVLLSCLVFSAIGVLCIRTGAPVRGVLILLFFGSGSLVSAAPVLFRGSICLRLTREGFYIRSLFRTHFLPWAQVSEFHVGTVLTMRANNKMVMFNILDGSDSKLRAYSREIAGYDAGLSDSYGMPHEKLCEIMNQWRSRNVQ